MVAMCGWGKAGGDPGAHGICLEYPIDHRIIITSADETLAEPGITRNHLIGILDSYRVNAVTKCYSSLKTAFVFLSNMVTTR